jgi:hypothetical protein
MQPRRTSASRYVLALVIVAFLAVLAWRWSLRAGRIDAATAPTPGGISGLTVAPREAA